MLKNKYKVFAGLLFIFYTVGIVGLSIPQARELLLQLTPFNLLLTLGLLLWMIRQNPLKQWLSALLIVFLIGFTVEVAGVHTGILFGEYRYGTPLGLKLWDVPLMIGVNWFLLAYASAGIAAYFTNNTWVRVIVASVLMVALDLAIEPVAIELDFWQWAGDEIPLQNYLMWFVTALVVQFTIKLTHLPVDKKTGAIVYAIQVYFFVGILLAGLISKV
jgi:putative membrane protein